MKLHLEEIIDYGGFGRVYVARITSCSPGTLKPEDLVVVKKCHVTKHVRYPALQHEACALLLLKGHISVPNVYAWGRSQYYEYLAMERLGEDVSSALNAEGGLTVRSLAGLVCRMLDAIQHVHSHGIVHCDIKPHNFLFGLTGADASSGELKLIDYGLARMWRDPATQAHISEGTMPGLVGTPDYASISVHRHHKPSRRDDIESLAYTIVKLLRGKLPWKETKAQDLLRAKLAWSGTTICAGYPTVFADFFDYARELSFDAEPDYGSWRHRFELLISADLEDDIANQLVGQPGDNVEPPFADADDPPSSRSNDDELPDSDDWWLPTSSWPPPHCVKASGLFGDEEAIVKAGMERIEEPPTMSKRWLQRGLIEVMVS